MKFVAITEGIIADARHAVWDRDACKTSVTSIGDYAFRGCKGLTSVTIGGSVTSIGEYTFWDCTGLTSIMFNDTKAQWNAISKGYRWNYNTGDYTIHCTDGDIPKQ